MIDIRDFSSGANVQAAIDAAFEGKTTLYFPAGEWDTEQPLAIPGRGFKISGESRPNLANTMLRYQGDSGSLLRGAAVDMSYGNWWGGIEIENITFSQAGLSPDPLVYLQGMIHSTFRNCRFYVPPTGQSLALKMDWSCTGNELLTCDFQAGNGLYAVEITGDNYTWPTLQRFVNCSFTTVSGGGCGILLRAANTHYFESCQFERLAVGVRLESLTDPVVYSKKNVFIAPRFENCLTEIDWTDTADRNVVVGRYTTSSGGDIGRKSYAQEIGFSGAFLSTLALNGYEPAGNDKLKLWSDKNGSGVGLYQDDALTNRLLSVYTEQGKPALRSKWGMRILSENPLTTASFLDVDMPVRLAQRTDAQAQPGTLYFSTDRNAVAFKDDCGAVYVLYQAA